MIILSVISFIGISAAFSAGDGSSASEQPIWSNFNNSAVRNNPQKTKIFTIDADAKPIRLHRITTFHWNSGDGAEPGTIGVYYEDGTMIASWQAAGRGGPDTTNTYWDADVDFVMLPGYSYLFKVSDNASWSWNAESDNCGMLELYGEQIENVNSQVEIVNQTIGGNSSACAEPARDMKIVLNDKTIDVNNANGKPVFPLILDETVYIPVEVVSEIIGQNVTWDKEKNTVFFGKQPVSGPGWRLVNTKYELYDEEDTDVYYQTYYFEGVQDDRVVFKGEHGCHSGDGSWYKVNYYECEIPPSFITPGQEVPLEAGVRIRNSWRGKKCDCFGTGNAGYYTSIIGSYGHMLTDKDGNRFVRPGNAMATGDGDWFHILEGKAWNDRPFNGQTGDIICTTDVGTYTWEYEYRE